MKSSEMMIDGTVLDPALLVRLSFLAVGRDSFEGWGYFLCVSPGMSFDRSGVMQSVA